MATATPRVSPTTMSDIAVWARFCKKVSAQNPSFQMETAMDQPLEELLEMAEDYCPEMVQDEVFKKKLVSYYSSHHESPASTPAISTTAPNTDLSAPAPLALVQPPKQVSPPPVAPKEPQPTTTTSELPPLKTTHETPKPTEQHKEPETPHHINQQPLPPIVTTPTPRTPHKLVPISSRITPIVPKTKLVKKDPTSTPHQQQPSPHEDPPAPPQPAAPAPSPEAPIATHDEEDTKQPTKEDPTTQPPGVVVVAAMEEESTTTQQQIPQPPDPQRPKKLQPIQRPPLALKHISLSNATTSPVTSSAATKMVGLLMKGVELIEENNITEAIETMKPAISESYVPCLVLMKACVDLTGCKDSHKAILSMTPSHQSIESIIANQPYDTTNQHSLKDALRELRTLTTSSTTTSTVEAAIGLLLQLMFNSTAEQNQTDETEILDTYKQAVTTMGGSSNEDAGVESKKIAEFQLGEMYWNSKNESNNSNNKEIAMKWYTRAMEEGHVEAKCRIAISHHIARNMETALNLYSEAAECGSALSAVNLGLCNELGDGKQANFTEAAKWYSIAATNGGDSTAKCNLAVCCHMGRGIAEDKAAAVRWWREAAEAGSPVGQFNLAVCHQSGFGGLSVDAEESVKWFKLAAEQGDVPACKSLAWCYTVGFGVKKDEKEADGWQRRAEEGNEQLNSHRNNSNNVTEMIPASLPSVPMATKSACCTLL